MSPETFAVAVGLAIFAAGVIGLILQRLLPDTSTTGGPRDMIGAVVGLLTLLSALVMGLLIWTAYGVYSGQNLAIQTLAAKVLQYDLALADYGPEAKDLRLQVRQALASTIEQVWRADESDNEFAAHNFAAAIKSLRNRDEALDKLTPTTDQQKTALAAAKAMDDSIGQSRLQMSFALTNAVSYPLILIVVGWAAILFCGFGLMSKGHTMSVVCVLVDAVAVASAVYLILDLSGPYSGVFRASPEPLEQVLAVMGKE
ncbi:MAG: hypothetical protein JOY52_11990 [Hyphomicrobiales bacterium]|nr:hypothetical protein [Hyphomicrobiales bacterium]